MKKVVLIEFIILLNTINVIANIDSTELKNNLSYQNLIDNYKLNNIQYRLDSLEYKTKSLTVLINKNNTYRCFYSSNIKSLTAIFTVIITLYTILIVYIIPKHLRKEWEINFNSLEKKHKKSKYNIKKNEKRLNQNALLQGTKVSRAMYHLSNEANNAAAAGVWSLRLAKGAIDLLETGYDVNEQKIIKYLKDSESQFKKCIEDYDDREDLRNDIDEINRIISYFKQKYKDNSEIAETLEKLQNNANLSTWKNKIKKNKPTG